MRYDALIFDLDGTIVDTEHLWQAAARELILSHGKLFTASMQKEIAHAMRGISLEPSLVLLKQMAGLDASLEALAEEKLQIVSRFYATDLCFVHGFLDFYNEVAQFGLKTAVATNSDSKTVEMAASALNLRRYFGQHIYHVDQVGVGKPDPRLYAYAAEQLGCQPCRCLALEDSAAGIQSAKGAGFFCIGLNTARDASKLAQADLVVDHYREIPLSSLMEGHS